MAWSWSFIPQRLFAEPAFLELDVTDRGVLLNAYARCDKFGRGPAHPTALRGCLSILDGHDVRQTFNRLAAARDGLGRAVLVQIYSVSGREYWQLANYDEDAPAELLRRRGTASSYPAPPDDVPPTSGGGPQTPPTVRQTPDDVRPSTDDVTQRQNDDATPSGTVRHSPTDASDRQATSGNAPPHARAPTRAAAPARAGGRDETETETETRSSQDGGLVAAGAHTPARAHEAPPVPATATEQARPAPPSSRPELQLVPPVPVEPPSPPRGPEPSSAVADWPPGTEEAAARWWGRLEQERPGPFGTGGYSRADLRRIAVEHPEHFAAAVDQHVGGVRGWKRTDPFAWLGRQCVFVAERAAEARARGRSGVGVHTPDDVPAVKRPRELYSGWNWRWDPPPADSPGLDAAWPSALDLPLEQHEALAWCTHTPDGPIEPPRRVAEVPGALEEYRRLYGGDAEAVA